MQESKLIVAKVQDKIKLHYKTGKITNTNMLDPLELLSVEPLLKNIYYIAYGGFENAERKVIFIGGEDVEYNDFLTILHIKSEVPLTHRSILGSILGLGVKRDVVGDIIIKNNECDVVILKEISKFIFQNLERIGREKVTIFQRKIEEIMELEDTSKIIDVTVPSMRLDAVISATFGVPREESAELIRRERVTINYQVMTNTSKQIKLNNLVSVRGHGRLEIIEQNGQTRSNRIRLKIRKW